MRSDDIDIPTSLFIQMLGADALLLFWDGRGPVDQDPVDQERGNTRRLSVRFAGAEIPCSRALMSLPITDHGERHLVAIRPPHGIKSNCEITIHHVGGPTLAAGHLRELDRSGDATLNVARLLQGCQPGARIRLARFIIEAAASALRLERDRTFIANVKVLLETLCRAPGRARVRAAINDRWILGDGFMRAGFGDRLAAILLEPDRLRILSSAPAKDATRVAKGDQTAFNFLLPAGIDWAAATEPPSLVVFGERGLAWRRIEGLGATLPNAVEWLDQAAAARRGARRYVLDVLARDRRRHPGSAAALREIELGGGTEGVKRLVGLGIETAIATSAGLFVAGRIGDAHGLAAALEFSAPGWAGATTISGLHCAAPAARGDRPFVALIAGEGTLPQEARIAVTIRLGSGMELDAGTVLASLGGAAAAQAIGAAIPAAARPAIVGEIFMPALDAIHADVAPAFDRAEIGEQPGAPRAEIVFAFPDDAMLRAAIFSSLAVDPSMREMTLGFWLRRPEDLNDAEQALRAAQVVYGRAFRLYAPAAVSGDAANLNAIVEQATAEHVILVDGGLLPAAVGWASGLLGMLESESAFAAACGMIIDSDGSISHAGYALARLADGLPGLDQPLAGFPAGLVGTGGPAAADALPAACLALRRQAFLDVGGFASGYLTRAYRDADLSLRLRAAGSDLACVARPAMIAFGPDVATSHADAWALADRQQFARRWASWLDGAPADAGEGPHPARLASDLVPEKKGSLESEPIVKFRRRKWAA